MGKEHRATDILTLPAAERLRLVEEIWDSLVLEPSSVPVPEWHRSELDRRLARYANSPEAARSWDQVKARLTRPRKARQRP